VVILQNKKIKVAPEILPDISSHLRGNPRSAVKLSGAIEKYCLINNSETFGEKEWAAFKKIEGLYPHGLDSVEVQVLKILKERGECSLNDLRAVTGLSKSALMNNHEVFLMHKGFLCVRGKRQITRKGQEVLKQIDELGI
jgi:Holliday junction resolvasome RuvABC ATP-dependent DNA helicase subunit